MMSKDLQTLVQDFATAMERIDKIVPPAKKRKDRRRIWQGDWSISGKIIDRTYCDRFKKSNSIKYEKLETEVKYPHDRKRCDIV